jgi:hypothetical protein
VLRPEDANIEASRGWSLVVVVRAGWRLTPDALGALADARAGAGTDLLYADDDAVGAAGLRTDPFFKPGWSPSLAASFDYVGGLVGLAPRLFEESGGLRPGFADASVYDLVLRAAEKTRRIERIPRLLASRPSSPTGLHLPSASASRKALLDAVRRAGRRADFEPHPDGGWKVRYRWEGTPLVSIIIPTRDNYHLLRECVSSIERLTRYPCYELVIVDTGSKRRATRAYLEDLGRRHVRLVELLHGRLQDIRVLLREAARLRRQLDALDQAAAPHREHLNRAAARRRGCGGDRSVALGARRAPGAARGAAPGR